MTPTTTSQRPRDYAISYPPSFHDGADLVCEIAARAAWHIHAGIEVTV